jgi:hypothetical protein
VVPYTPDEALSLFIEAHLTKSQQTKIRSEAKIKNCKIYLSYRVIKAAKEERYPLKDKILIQESLVEVDLQALLDKTASRIIMAQKNVIDIFLDDTSKEFVLISKWGCDGSTGQGEYKQQSLEGVSDSDIFITSVVPLQLYSTKISGVEIILWQNPKPSSVRYCRPIRKQFKKETAELAKEEISIVEESIKKLETTVITLEEQNSVISASHKMVLTMIDGKICNAVTSTTSAQVCYVCGAAPKQMNSIDEIVKKC